MQDPSVSFIESQPLSETRLSESDIQSWREKGFALVHDLLPRPLLAELKQDAAIGLNLRAGPMHPGNKHEVCCLGKSDEPWLSSSAQQTG